MPSKNSSKERFNRTLADVDAFLQTFANDLDYSRKRFPGLMPPVRRFAIFAAAERINQTRSKELRAQTVEGQRAGTGKEVRPIKALSDVEVIEMELSAYQEFMRSAWLAPTDRQRRYWTFKLLQKLYDSIEADLRDRVPKTINRLGPGKWERVAPWKPEYGDQVREFPETPFEKAIHRLENLAGRTKCCGNPTCSAPLFIGSRRTQRYCSDGCAAVFQQEAKRKWWQQYGSEWRKGRQQNKKRGTSHGKATGK